jgi:alpha-maltose-1-phosphate synthase
MAAVGRRDETVVAATRVPSRVLFVNENIGGHAAMHIYMRQALREHPHVLAQFLDVPRPGLVRRLAAASVPGLARHDLDLQPLRYQLAQSLYVRNRLRRWPVPFDALHLYTQNAALLSTGLMRKCPSVVSTDATTTQGAYNLSYRHPTQWTASRVRLSRRAEANVYDSATLVVAQSEWVASSLRGVYGLPDDKIRVIPFGITIHDLPPRRTPPGLPQVTFVGTTMDRKGGWRLLRSFRRRLRGKCTLNLVTRDPVSPEPGVQVFGDFQPGDPRLHDLLAETAVFAFPSGIDHSPYSVLEAMRAGLPVVTTRVGSLPEMVVDGETGLFVDHDDEALAAAISRLLDDPEGRARMGAAARARVVERFDAQGTTGELLEVLAEARARFRAQAPVDGVNDPPGYGT